MPGFLLGAGDKAVNKAESLPKVDKRRYPQGTYILGVEGRQ